MGIGIWQCINWYFAQEYDPYVSTEGQGQVQVGRQPPRQPGDDYVVVRVDPGGQVQGWGQGTNNHRHHGGVSAVIVNDSLKQIIKAALSLPTFRPPPMPCCRQCFARRWHLR